MGAEIAMTDIFEDRSSGLESPAFNAAEITPDDLGDLSTTSRAIYIGTGGDLHVTTAGGSDVTFRNVAAGFLPVRVRRIHATATTASDIVAVW